MASASSTSAQLPLERVLESPRTTSYPLPSSASCTSSSEYFLERSPSSTITYEIEHVSSRKSWIESEEQVTTKIVDTMSYASPHSLSSCTSPISLETSVTGSSSRDLSPSGLSSPTKENPNHKDRELSKTQIRYFLPMNVGESMITRVSTTYVTESCSSQRSEPYLPSTPKKPCHWETVNRYPSDQSLPMQPDSNAYSLSVIPPSLPASSVNLSVRKKRSRFDEECDEKLSVPSPDMLNNMLNIRSGI